MLDWEGGVGRRVYAEIIIVWEDVCKWLSR